MTALFKFLYLIIYNYLYFTNRKKKITMPYIQNKIKKMITYFIKECARLHQRANVNQEGQMLMRAKIYEGIDKLSKQKRTKSNLQVLLFGSKQQLFKLFDKLKVKYNNVDWQYLQDAQLKVTSQICVNYEENYKQLWERYRKIHDQEDCLKMEVYVNHVIIKKKLKWEETGNRRMNMRRIQQPLQSTQNETQNEVQIKSQITSSPIIYFEEVQFESNQSYESPIIQQEQSQAEHLNMFQIPQKEFKTFLSSLDYACCFDSQQSNGTGFELR